jgi:hypothetical protein
VRPHVGDTISDDCFYDTCGNCEWAACRCECHDEQEFSLFYGWQDLDDWYWYSDDGYDYEAAL